MQIIVRLNSRQQEEWIQKGSGHGSVEFIHASEPLPAKPFDAFIDLLYTPDTQYASLPATTILVVNAVTAVCQQLPADTIRMNAWPGFLRRPVTELAAGTPVARERAAKLMEVLGWAWQLAPDVPGMVTSRIIAGIINEAYFALDEALSTRNEIDTAMKLGTNYPYGPFEWADIIGIQEIHGLLQTLSIQDARYTPAPLLSATADK